MRITLYIKLCLIFFVLNSISSYGQEEFLPYHQILSVEDGLPSNRAYDLIQDQKGYIWIGTDNGLVKYNGKEFKKYTSSESINSEYSYLHELKDGSIWCINFGNQVFKISGDSLVLVDVFKPYINDNKYFKFHEWKDSILYLESQNRIIGYDPFENTMKEISNGYQTSSFAANEHSIFYKKNKKGRIHFTVYDIKNNKKNKIKLNRTNIVKTFTNDSESFLFTFSRTSESDGNIYSFNPSDPNDFNQQKPIITFPNAGLHSFHNISTIDSTRWVNTINGTINIANNYKIFADKNITKIIQDHEQNYWITTYNSGVIFIPNIKLKKHSQFPNSIQQIEFVDSSQLLISTTDGYAHVLNIEESKIENSFYIEKISNRKLPIIKDSPLLFISNTNSYTLNINNGQKNKVNLSINLKSFTKIEDNILFQNGNNTLIICNNDIFNGQHSSSPNFKLSEIWKKNEPLNKQIAAGNFTRMTLEDSSQNIENIHYESSNKRIWIAYSNKTSTEQNQVFTDFKNKLNENLKLNCFADYLDKGIVAGLREHGLIFIEGNEITHQKTEGVYKEFGPIRDIFTTDSLVISLAEKGIIFSDLEGKPLHTLDGTDGLKGSTINDIQIHSNYIWIGTNNGLYYISFNDIRDNTTPPRIYINSILIDNQAMTFPLMENSFPNNSDIEINFEALSFKGKDTYKYQYQLKADEKWQNLPSTASSIRLPNLASGKYEFKIKVINEENISSKIALANFEILPPIWLRWWFLLGSFSLIIFALYWYNQRNLKKIEKENQLEKKRIEKENQWEQEIRSNKLSALQSRMNPHFIFNSLNSIQDFIIKLDKEGANEYLGIFSDLMRIYLNHSQKDKIDLYEETEALKLYLKLEQLRFPDIKVEFKIANVLKSMDIMIPPLFIQPYIENAFKHGLLHKKEDKSLNIEFSYFNNHLIIDIEDNGVGRDKVREIQERTALKGLSYATKANQTRLELLNHNRTKKLTVKAIDLYKNNIPAGTAIKIHIPINNE